MHHHWRPAYLTSELHKAAPADSICFLGAEVRVLHKPISRLLQELEVRKTKKTSSQDMASTILFFLQQDVIGHQNDDEASYEDK